MRPQTDHNSPADDTSNQFDRGGIFGRKKRPLEASCGELPGNFSPLNAQPAMPQAPIRVLHVVNSLEPGGMENGVVNVASRLDPAAFQVQVCCLERVGKFAARLPGHVPVQVLNKQPGFSVWTVFSLARVIAQFGPSVLHTHNLGPLIYASLAKGLGQWQPILHGEHSQLNEDELSPRRMRQRRWLYHGCRCVHTVSESLRHHLLELGLTSEKWEVIANGVDTQRFRAGDRAAARRSLGLPGEGLVVGMVGRFGLLKRHTLLLDSFALLAQRMDNVRLLIVGGGGPEEQRVIEQAKASKVSARIHLAGFQNDTAPFYQAMDLLVVPSVNEGLSNAVLEAMASGIPAVCHTACGNAEVITSGADGFVAPLDNVEALAAQLQETLASPARLAWMGQKAREKVVGRFSLATMAENYARLYRELVVGSRPINQRK